MGGPMGHVSDLRARGTLPRACKPRSRGHVSGNPVLGGGPIGACKWEGCFLSVLGWERGVSGGGRPSKMPVFEMCFHFLHCKFTIVSSNVSHSLNREFILFIFLHKFTLEIERSRTVRASAGLQIDLVVSVQLNSSSASLCWKSLALAQPFSVAVWLQHSLPALPLGLFVACVILCVAEKILLRSYRMSIDVFQVKTSLCRAP